MPRLHPPEPSIISARVCSLGLRRTTVSDDADERTRFEMYHPSSCNALIPYVSRFILF